MGRWLPALGVIGLAIGALALPAAFADTPDAVDPAPTSQDWAAIGKLPDWSGVWFPDLKDQDQQIRSNPTPWTPGVAQQIAAMDANEKAGKPRGLFVDCLPEGMPSWMMISHNAMEIVFTPGRVLILGESDGNRLRRIYTDGRGHPDDPDPSFHGHSIGHWDGETLVVDTIGILPETFIALGEGVGIPNNGDMRIVEHLHLTGPNTLHDDLEITAPHVLSTPWKTTRIFYRQRQRKFDLVEGECLQGSFGEQVDAQGNAVFVPLNQDGGGNVVPSHK